MSLTTENVHAVKMASQSTVTPETQSFSAIVRQEKTPTRDQGIIVDAIEGHTVEEYAIA